ncbi:hypothetical protein RF11_14813 [Thelohanellus kitauei]|uniref:Uncharacterized protein n=1 Tax=Thelohanellus kitauei TaxID=669202 RepID=A0A0C2MII8_THEKT|nr:hypothetical protein RF11_14813 [Thelohanellus kitauei]
MNQICADMSPHAAICPGKNQFNSSNNGKLEVYKLTPVHYCTDFISTANATVSTYGRDVPREGTLLQPVRVVQDHTCKTFTPILCPLDLCYQIGIRSLGSSHLG